MTSLCDGQALDFQQISSARVKIKVAVVFLKKSKMVSGLAESAGCASSTSDADDWTNCPENFDSLLCWPRTPSNSVATMSCFAHLNGIRYDTTQNATRECLSTGTWAEYTDYSNCRELENEHIVNDHVSHSIELTTTIYLFGYTVSLIALAVAVYIFCRYK